MMIRRLVIWTIAFYLASTIFFATEAGLLAIFGYAGKPAPFDLTFAVQIAAFGLVHWALMSLVSLPVFMVPVLVWPMLARVAPLVETNIRFLIGACFVLSLVAIIIRALVMEWPGLMAHPGPMAAAYVRSPVVYLELAATWLGLSVPRLILPSLRPGVFVSGAAGGPVAA
jgi:hypothetical protein